ncbi:MAG: hypothetical protein RRY34_02255, partial [Victivallaceae bacterium]
AFYEKLSNTPELHNEAMELQNIHDEQEKLINEFIALAKREGFDFSFQEFVEYLYEHAQTEEKRQN